MMLDHIEYWAQIISNLLMIYLICEFIKIEEFEKTEFENK